MKSHPYVLYELAGHRRKRFKQGWPAIIIKVRSKAILVPSACAAKLIVKSFLAPLQWVILSAWNNL